MQQHQPQQNKAGAEFEKVDVGSPVIKILTEKYGWKCWIPDNKPLPAPNERFKALFPRELDQISRLRDYYSVGYILQDHFASHAEDRRPFYKDVLGVRVGEWLKEHSKLAANNWLGRLTDMGEILSALKSKRAPLNSEPLGIKALEHEGSRFNAGMTFEEKVAHVAKVDAAILDLFTQLSLMK
jgi:hypothetical protein